MPKLLCLPFLHRLKASCRLSWAWIVLLTGLCMTAIAMVALLAMERKASESAFQFKVDHARQLLDQRMFLYQHWLLQLALQFIPNQASSTSLRHTLDRTGWRESCPGVLALGFVRANDWPTKHHETPSSPAPVTIDDAPWDNRSGNAIPAFYMELGSDVKQQVKKPIFLTNPVLEAALLRASEGTSVVSGKLPSVAGDSSRAAFLVVVPVFSTVSTVFTSAPHRAIDGYAFAVIDSKDFFENALRDLASDVQLRIFGNDRPDSSSVLYATPLGTAAGITALGSSGLIRTILLTGRTRTWRLTAVATPAFTQAWRSHLPTLVGMLGLAFSLMMFWLSQFFIRKTAFAASPAEAARHATLSKAREIARFGNYEVVTHPSNGTQGFWDDGLRHILGRYAPERCIRLDDYIERLVHTEDRERVRAVFDRLQSEGGRAELEYRIVRSDGVTVYLHEVMHAFANGARQKTICGVRCDITERRIAEQERILSAMKFLTLMDQLPGVPYLARFGEHGRATYVSPKLTTLLGFQADEWAANTKLRIRQLHPEDRTRVLQTIAQTITTKGSFVMEYRIYHASGKLMWLRDEARVICDSAGRARFLQGVVLDITDRNQAQQELQRAHQQLQQMISSLDSLREEECRRLAKEIHDDFGQLLVAMKIDMERLQAMLPADAPRLARQVGAINSLVETMMTSVRRIIADLPPKELHENGLFKALKLLAASFSKRHRIICRLSCSEQEPLLDDAIAKAIYRMAQEALNNVAKHAQATRIDIQIDCHDAHLVLCINDNGQGFRTDRLDHSGSFGLIGMRERVAVLDGDLHIDSKPGCGTSIQIVIPLKASQRLC